MTREEAIFCEGSYLGENNCIDCKYYATDTCESRESHKMAIAALKAEPCEVTWVTNNKGEGVAFKNMPIEKVNKILAIMDDEPCEDAISQKIDEFELNGKTAEIWIVKGKLQIRCLGIIHNFPLPPVAPKQRWISVSERLPTKEEYIANNGLFIVSDGNRTYSEYFDVYSSMKYFGEPTMNNGFRVDKCVIAWMPLPEPYKDGVSE